jgi:hypothetical protein
MDELGDGPGVATHHVIHLLGLSMGLRVFNDLTAEGAVADGFEPLFQRLENLILPALVAERPRALPGALVFFGAALLFWAEFDPLPPAVAWSLALLATAFPAWRVRHRLAAAPEVGAHQSGGRGDGRHPRSGHAFR